MRRRGHRHQHPVRRMTWLEITLWSIPATIPALLVWRWRVRRAQAKLVADIMAERRARFGGAIKLPGQRDVTRIDRP